MSIASISYSSIKDAKQESNRLSKKLDKYADNLNDQVYRKLNSYNGKWSGNLSNAKNKIGSKISDLRSASTKYNNYANDLENLKDECKSTDKAVKSRIATLTASFKKSNGIRNSHIENGLYYIGVSVGNSSAAGRWVNDKFDKGKQGITYIKDRLKAWYNYEGGKELIKGILTSVLDVVIAVASVIAIITSGGALLVVIATCVAAAIAVFNAGVNLGNEMNAYKKRQNGDPAMGKRYSAEDTIQDTLRKETDSSFWHGVAKGVDRVLVVCTLIQVGDGIKNLVKKGIKWATNSPNNLKEIRMKDVFSKNFFKGIGNKLKNGASDIFKAAKSGDWHYFKSGTVNFLTDFKANLLKTYTQNGFKSLQSGASLLKDFVNDGINGKLIFEKIVMPGITIGESDYTISENQIQINFDGVDRIVANDFYDIGNKIKNKIVGSDAFGNGTSFDPEVLEKLSSFSSVDISVPNIKVPNINITQYAA